jgi:uncharacterized protein
VRAVLDPNVIISGLLSPRGSPAALLRALEAGEMELVASPALIEELERALGYPKLRRHIPAEDAAAAVDWVLRSATFVVDPSDPPSVRSEDPGDDYLIALAERERAALVSGDKHLLKLAGRLPVFSAREFLELLGSA